MQWASSFPVKVASSFSTTTKLIVIQLFSFSTTTKLICEGKKFQTLSIQLFPCRTHYHYLSILLRGVHPRSSHCILTCDLPTLSGMAPDHSIFTDKPLEDLNKDLSKGSTSVQVTALDGLVNVNSLFTVAVFVGLSLATPGQKSLEHSSGCDAGKNIIKNLMVFEVISFSSFLFSSLVAQGLKLAINIDNSKDPHEATKGHINNKLLRTGMLASALGSINGCVFLMLSMVNVIQITLGVLSCGVTSTVAAIATLIALVSTALVVYISTVIYAFTH